MQNPDANQEILEDVESGERAIGAANLWKPGETITVSCDKSTTVPNLESLVKKYVMQDIQPYVSVKFKFVNSGGQVVVKWWLKQFQRVLVLRLVKHIVVHSRLIYSNFISKA